MSSPIDRAIARVVKVAEAEGPTRLAEVRVRVTEAPLVVRESGELSITRAPDSPATLASLMVWDPDVQAFRPVLLPPGTSWELVQKAQGSALWKPGMLP